jgi:hypothetical protein
MDLGLIQDFLTFRIVEFLGRVYDFRFRVDVINVFDHYDVHDNKWKGIVGMESFFFSFLPSPGSGSRYLFALLLFPDTFIISHSGSSGLCTIKLFTAVIYGFS